MTKLSQTGDGFEYEEKRTDMVLFRAPSETPSVSKLVEIGGAFVAHSSEKVTYVRIP